VQDALHKAFPFYFSFITGVACDKKLGTKKPESLGVWKAGGGELKPSSLIEVYAYVNEYPPTIRDSVRIRIVAIDSIRDSIRTEISDSQVSIEKFSSPKPHKCKQRTVVLKD